MYNIGGTAGQTLSTVGGRDPPFSQPAQQEGDCQGLHAGRKVAFHSAECVVDRMPLFENTVVVRSDVSPDRLVDEGAESFSGYGRARLGGGMRENRPATEVGDLASD